jgi:hypothetical protein
MTFEECVAKLRGPRNMFIIDIEVTNACDLACSNCTRLLANQEKLWFISPENFRLALKSLEGYGGIIAMIGGNPCMHPKFKELCAIFAQEIPDRLQRGLWTNNPFKHEQLCQEIFGTLNLNAHGEKRAQAPLTRMMEHGRGNGKVVWTYMGNSLHAPLLTAVKDVYRDPDTMWEKISQCEINRDWSATIVPDRNGELKAYFCEVAASFDIARGGDNGLPVYPGWWRQDMQPFAGQVKTFCPGCGAPAKQKASKDCEELDTYSETNADLAAKAKGRKTQLLVSPEADERQVTRYGELVP